MIDKVRNSSFELLRIVLMFFIVMYHFLVFIYRNECCENEPLYKALWLPLHIAVICFVLISGYFRIKPTIKGALKLILPVITYYTIVGIVYNVCISDYSLVSWSNYFLFLSRSPYWFIRTYLYLFLLSPLLNKWLDSSSITKKLYLLAVLAFISVYCALLGDPSVQGGKNVILFMSIYVTGDVLKEKSHIFKKINVIWLSIGWILFNILLILLWLNYEGTLLGKTIWYLSFQYCGPVLILNAICFFVIFSRLRIHCLTINRLATSVFAITENIVIKELFLHPGLNFIFNSNSNVLIVVFAVALYSLIVMGICVLLDQFVQPLFKRFISLIPS